MYEIETLLRVRIELPDARSDDEVEELGNKIIESLYDEYDGVQNVDIVDWNMWVW